MSSGGGYGFRGNYKSVYRNVFLVLTPNEYERWGLSVGVLIYVNNDDIISAYVDVYVAFWDLFQV